MIPKKADLCVHALEYLNTNKIMTLATCSKNIPWASTVFFAYTKKFDIIFFSNPETKHCLNLTINPDVAGTINQDWGEKGFIKGIQFLGTTEEENPPSLPTSLKLRWTRKLRRAREGDKYYKIFLKRYKWAKDYPDHRIYVIKLKELWMIDSKLLGHHFRVRVI